MHETRRARELRRAETAAEARIWQRLRGRNLKGYKFVRQLPIGPYFADFACREEKLIVEIDGATHGTDEEIRRDERRSAFLEEFGYRIIRFINYEVCENLDGVMETILAALERRTIL
jgi:very-short-patch-repair endonuclease